MHRAEKRINEHVVFCIRITTATLTLPQPATLLCSCMFCIYAPRASRPTSINSLYLRSLQPDNKFACLAMQWQAVLVRHYEGHVPSLMRCNVCFTCTFVCLIAVGRCVCVCVLAHILREPINNVGNMS